MRISAALSVILSHLICVLKERDSQGAKGQGREVIMKKRGKQQCLLGVLKKKKKQAGRETNEVDKGYTEETVEDGAGRVMMLSHCFITS